MYWIPLMFTFSIQEATVTILLVDQIKIDIILKLLVQVLTTNYFKRIILILEQCMIFTQNIKRYYSIIEHC
jgi:hypothetical protein